MNQIKSHSATVPPELTGDQDKAPDAPFAVNASAAMETLVGARVQAILDAHANNMIEGLDSGAEWRTAILELARLPISNEEFTLLAEELADAP